jgi:type II secretory pathway component PulC
MKSKYDSIAACALLAVAFASAIMLWPSSGLGDESTAPAPSAADEVQPSAAPERSDAVQNSWEKYQIILQRNIFSQQRGPIRRSREERPRPVITRNPESYLVLKGIVQENNTFIAFIEDTRTNTAVEYHAGDSVARGVVKNFTLDSIEYQLDNKATQVTVGHDLEGGQGTIPMNRLLQMSAASSPPSDPNAATATPTPSGDEAEILKRLMEQRKQQLGK